MRRNFNAGQNWQSSGGRPPMVTDLGLQDIDKELELLQRKREIIEQQQQMLSNDFCGRNEYEESYSHSSRFYDFGQSFNDRRDYNPPSRKRPIPVWEDGIPNKRFSGGSERSRSRAFERPTPPPLMRSGPIYNPLLCPVRPQSGPFRPKPPRRSPPKTVKGPAPPPIRPRPNERKKAPEPVKAPYVKSPDELNRLYPNREPTKQVRGRLELALGSIIKEIRADLGQETLKAPAVVRDVKTVVRDRIRDIMMGQVVGTSESIIAKYREVYGKPTDADLVANAVLAQTGDVAPFKIEDPEKYFKVNMQRLMQLKLKSILDQIEEAARAECEANNETKTESVAEVGETNADADEPKEKIPVVEEADKNPLDERITSTDKFKALEKWMTGKMGSMIKKYLPNIMKIVDIDAKYTRLKNTITSETVKMLVGKNEQEITNIVEGTNESADQDKTPYKPLPHYAKLLGRPGLPRRNQMQQFFENYKPKSIKKHRTVHNLLFVGFADKESFDDFLKADGTVIGKCTLNIRYSDKARTESNGKHPRRFNSQNTSQNTSINSQNVSITSISSEDKLIGSELDDQITNLLSSIRNEEENDTSVTEANEVKTDVSDVKANGNVITEENDAKTDENGVKTNENGVKTEENDVKTEANEENIDGNEGNAVDADVKTEIADEKTNIDADTTTVIESNEATDNSSDIKKDNGTEEEADEIKPLDDKPVGRATPARASSRLAATPSRIQTRRASRLAQHDA